MKTVKKNKEKYGKIENILLRRFFGFVFQYQSEVVTFS